MKASEIIPFFKGAWAIERQIISEKSNISAKGEAAFVSENTCLLRYDEKLEILVDNSPLESYRRYYYEYDKKADKCFKYFDDKRLFYELITGQAQITGHHECIKDIYEARYTISEDARFNLEYKVFGPSKNHQIITRYLRR